MICCIYYYFLTKEAKCINQRRNLVETIQASIDIEKNENQFDCQKTLIHEAFHIIVGCKDEECDVSCEKSITGQKALNRILRCKGKETIPADWFAQFVMKCDDVDI